MKKTLLTILVLAGLTLSACTAEARVAVRGYTRSNGTRVNPHYRSSPDGIRSNNYGYRW